MGAAIVDVDDVDDVDNIGDVDVAVDVSAVDVDVESVICLPC